MMNVVQRLPDATTEACESNMAEVYAPGCGRHRVPKTCAAFGEGLPVRLARHFSRLAIATADRHGSTPGTSSRHRVASWPSILFR